MLTEPAGPRQTQGLRVLVVEDEFLIAIDLQLMLEDVGCTVLGPVGTVDDALRILDETRPDVVSLDLNLRGESSVPVAEKLRAPRDPVHRHVGLQDLRLCGRREPDRCHGDRKARPTAHADRGPEPDLRRMIEGAGAEKPLPDPGPLQPNGLAL
ncbi:response regulator [Cereibacter sphaeroides f. sp. denitrificans]